MVWVWRMRILEGLIPWMLCPRVGKAAFSGGKKVVVVVCFGWRIFIVIQVGVGAFRWV